MLAIRGFLCVDARMNAVPAVVYLILIVALPVKPGGSGFIFERVVQGAPSAQKALAWGREKFQREMKQAPAPCKIGDTLVVPVSQMLLTEDGQEMVKWSALPSPEARQISPPGAPIRYDAAFESEWGLMVDISPVNQTKNDPTLDMKANQVRDWLRQHVPNGAKLNWDDRKAWYYIAFTRHEAHLLKAVNFAAAVVRYGKAVRGTPAGDEEAKLSQWDVLDVYHEPNTVPSQ